MPSYRKKPVVVQAYQLQDLAGEETKQLPPPWLIAAMSKEENETGAFHPCPSGEGYWINTLEGTMRAFDGDWIIQGVQGEIYPCKNDIFRATYEAVDDSK